MTWGQPDSPPGMRQLALLLHIFGAATGYTQPQTSITPSLRQGHSLFKCRFPKSKTVAVI